MTTVKSYTFLRVERTKNKAQKTCWFYFHGYVEGLTEGNSRPVYY